MQRMQSFGNWIKNRHLVDQFSFIFVFAAFVTISKFSKRLPFLFLCYSILMKMNFLHLFLVVVYFVLFICLLTDKGATAAWFCCSDECSGHNEQAEKCLLCIHHFYFDLFVSFFVHNYSWSVNQESCRKMCSILTENHPQYFIYRRNL